MTERRRFDTAVLKRSPLLGQLQEDDLDEILALARVRRFEAEEIIFSKGDRGDSLYAILSGRVSISTVSESGKVIILNVLQPGDVFGEIAVLDGGERTASATALEDSELIRIGRVEFIPLLQRRPLLCVRLMELLCHRLRWTSDIIEDMLFLEIPQRLAKRLLALARTEGEQVGKTIRIRLQFSQEDLAQMLGATRESINKSLRALQNGGLIDYNTGHLTLIDIPRLEEMAGIRSPYD